MLVELGLFLQRSSFTRICVLGRWTSSFRRVALAALIASLQLSRVHVDKCRVVFARMTTASNRIR